jgi:pyridoxine kinase
MAGRDLAEATRFASDFVPAAMKVTSHQPDFQNRGVSFEPLLGTVASLLQ